MSNDLEYLENDGGKYEAGFVGKKITGDCVTRAITIATGLQYSHVRRELMSRQFDWSQKHNSKAAKRCRARSTKSVFRGVWAEVYKKYLDDLGWTYVSCAKVGDPNKKYMNTLDIPVGIVIVKQTKHLACVIDHVVNDSWDCRQTYKWIDGQPTERKINKCVWGYWIKSSTERQATNERHRTNTGDHRDAARSSSTRRTAPRDCGTDAR